MKISDEDLKKFPIFRESSALFWERVEKSGGYSGAIVVSRAVADEEEKTLFVTDLVIVEKATFGYSTEEGAVVFKVPEGDDLAYLFMKDCVRMVKIEQIQHDQFKNIKQNRSFYWSSGYVRPFYREEWSQFKANFDKGDYDKVN
jgi:hypothetical protein